MWHQGTGRKTFLMITGSTGPTPLQAGLPSWIILITLVSLLTLSLACGMLYSNPLKVFPIRRNIGSLLSQAWRQASSFYRSSKFRYGRSSLYIAHLTDLSSIVEMRQHLTGANKRRLWRTTAEKERGLFDVSDR